MIMAKTISLQQLAKIQRIMMRLDPDTMATVMAWNSSLLEYSIPEDKGLQGKYMDLLKRAKAIYLKENKRI
jgi:hypothetical protein